MNKRIKVPFSVTIKVQIGNSNLDAQVTGEAEYYFELICPDAHGTRTGTSFFQPRYARPNMGIINETISYNTRGLLDLFEEEVKSVVRDEIFEKLKPETPEVEDKQCPK